MHQQAGSPSTTATRPEVSEAGAPARVVWLTGLSGAGKSTIARALGAHLRARGRPHVVIDGDAIREGLSADLGFSAADRAENVRRVGEMARLLCDSGIGAIVALISPSREARDRVRSRFQPGQFIEVHVAASLAACEARDVKGLYAAVRQGRVQTFTGISAPYDDPVHPELVVRTEYQSVDECATLIAERYCA
jgi:adenylyl-sulfate kinase